MVDEGELAGDFEVRDVANNDEAGLFTETHSQFGNNADAEVGGDGMFYPVCAAVFHGNPKVNSFFRKRVLGDLAGAGARFA